MAFLGTFAAMGKSASSPRGRNTPQADAIAKILLVIWGKVWYTDKRKYVIGKGKHIWEIKQADGAQAVGRKAAMAAVFLTEYRIRRTGR